MVSKLDVFRYCQCLRCAGSIMIVAVLGLEGFVYYAVMCAYVPRLKQQSAGTSFLGILVVLTFTFMCAMLTWSYLVSAFSDPGSVPVGWHPFASPVEEEYMRSAALAAPVSGLPPSAPGRGARFCRKCGSWKPPRAHHCTVLGRCVLKMDHFCLWIVNAVGLLNYKAFLLFIAYAFLACTEATIVLLPAAVRIISARGSSGKDASVVLMALVLTFAFAVALAAFAALHWHMVSCNYTSVESLDYGAVSSWPHDKGLKRNMQEVFGRRRNWWCVPVLSDDDRAWLLAQSLEAQAQPLVYSPAVPKQPPSQMV